MAVERSRAPAVVWLMAVTAALPFLVLGVATAYGPENYRGPALLALMAYATAVLCFLGGAHYGEEVAGRGRPHVLLVSSLPALAGWLILIAPARFTGAGQLMFYIAAFVATWAWSVVSRTTPNWRSPVRTVMAAVACLSLALALFGTMNAGI